LKNLGVSLKRWQLQRTISYLANIAQENLELSSIILDKIVADSKRWATLVWLRTYSKTSSIAITLIIGTA
jgi:hypothetical protein